MKIRFRSVDSVADDLEAVRQRIAVRAVELFRDRGAAVGRALDDWLKAEKETVWRPAFDVHRRNGAFVVEAATAGVRPAQLDVRVTANELLLSADLRHAHREQEGETIICEFARGPLFRSYRFPEPINPAGVSAEYKDGLLRVTAPLAHPAAKVEVQAM